MRAAPSVFVWDSGVRIFHWVLVLAVLVAGITGFLLGRTVLAWHLVAGEVAMVAVAWRAIWGFLGFGYARFASFAYRPSDVLAHFRTLRQRDGERHLGHNPLGAAMIFALLAVLAAIGVSGVITLGGLLKQGPLRSALSYATGDWALQIHALFADMILAMIGLHLAGVAFESWRGRENLVAAMFTGRKAAVVPPEPAPPGRAHPGIAMTIMLAILAVSVGAILKLSALPGLLMPPANSDPVFEVQCGACHLAFPASLAPSSTWTRILADTKHHFGADASLTDEQIETIGGWLLANSAEHWDTLPSHVLRAPAADGSLRITDTPGWRARHRGIAPAVFTTKPVYRPSNCAACHADAASGIFAPQNIAIPEAGAAQ